MRALILNKFNKKPSKKMFEFKNVVNMQISVFLPLHSFTGASDLEIPASHSSSGRQFLSVCLVHRNMSPSGCLHTEIIAPLYSAHLATLLKAVMLRPPLCAFKALGPHVIFQAHMKTETAQVGGKKKAPTWPSSKDRILAAENKRGNLHNLHELATVL